MYKCSCSHRMEERGVCVPPSLCCCLLFIGLSRRARGGRAAGLAHAHPFGLVALDFLPPLQANGV